MIFDLKDRKKIIPEIGDTFTCTNGDKVYTLHVEEPVDGTCSGCAFENLCKESDINKTQFTCYGEERPDGKDVIFVWN